MKVTGKFLTLQIEDFSSYSGKIRAWTRTQLFLVYMQYIMQLIYDMS